MRKKGFTLIELLGVIIVVAVIAIIAIPITLDVIEDVREEANYQTVVGLINGAKNYYAESMFDESKKQKVDNYADIYKDVQVDGQKPENGKLYVDSDGNVAISVIVGDKLYVKHFTGELETKENENNELEFVGKDDSAPEVKLDINITTPDIIVNGWYTKSPEIEITVDEEGTGVDYVEWCQGIDCIPNNKVTESTVIKPDDSKETQICVIAYDKFGNASEKVCTDKIMIDTVGPEISGVGDLVVQVNEEVDLEKDVEVTDVTSGVNGTFTTNPETVNTSKTGTYEVVYTVVDNAGNKTEVTRKVIVSANAPTITYSVAERVINENGWAKDNFFVTINVKDNTGQGLKEFKVCTSSTDTCDPTNGSVITDSTTATREIVVESANNRICVQATDNDNQTSDIICSDAYKLDKTAPVAGTINITGTKGENDWYTSDVTIEAVDGSDTLSGHLSTVSDITSITENTEGTKVTITTTDKAGNTSTNEYTIKVDKTVPTATINRTTSDNKNILTGTINPSENLSGYTYQWYKGTTAITGATSISYTTSEAGTYKLKVTTGSGKVVSSNEIEIKSYSITYDLNGGTGSIASTSKVEDINTNITNTIPARSGYTFVGWGLTSSDKTSTYANNATYQLNENKTLYAIWKKGYTLTFVANGATLSSTSVGCEVYNAETSCKITTPTITRSNYTIIGFNTNKDATSKEISHNSEISINSNATYYAITSKTLTANFVANNATLVDTANTDSNTKDTCTMYNTATTCTVYSPNITAPTNTPTVLGFNTTSNATSSTWNVNTAKSISSDVTYYAITRKDAKTYTITYTKGTGVSAIGSTSGSCNIAATYNGTAQATTCSVTLPSITASTGYTVAGWYNSSNTKLGNASVSISVSATQTITAKATINSYTCSAGYYLGANATSCTKCEAGSYCGGGTYTYSSSTQGKSTCPSGYGTSAAGSSAAGNCYKTITVTYAGNGATSGSTSSSSCNAYYNNGSCSITLRANGFTRTNYTFQGWGTGTSSVTHSASTSYSFSSNTTLYAIWKASTVAIDCSTYYSLIYNSGIEPTFCTSSTGTAQVGVTTSSCLASAKNASSSNTCQSVCSSSCSGASGEALGSCMTSCMGGCTSSFGSNYESCCKTNICEVVVVGRSNETGDIGFNITYPNTVTGYGTLTCTSSNNSIATCSISNYLSGSTKRSLHVKAIAPGSVTLTISNTKGQTDTVSFKVLTKAETCVNQATNYGNSCASDCSSSCSGSACANCSYAYSSCYNSEYSSCMGN